MINEQKISLTLEEACGATGLNRSRLYQAVNSGHLRSFKAGRRRMISTKALQEYINRLERESAKGAA